VECSERSHLAHPVEALVHVAVTTDHKTHRSLRRSCHRRTGLRDPVGILHIMMFLWLRMVMTSPSVLVVLKPNRIIHRCTDANCSSFHPRVFLGLSNPQGQRQTCTLSIPRDNFGERKAKFNLETSRTTQMQLYKCIHIS
jgi:hypothetical protein